MKTPFQSWLPALAAVALGAAASATLAQSDAAPIESNPLAVAPRYGPGPLFEALPARDSGIDFAHRWDPPPMYEQQLDASVVGGGACIGDADGDGLPDVYLTTPYGGSRLYRNLGGFRFEDATESAGLDDGGAWGTGATFADVDNDGDLDLYVCGYDTANRLYFNRGDGTFTENAAAAGLDFSGASIMMAFADIDSDGDLDGYLLTNRLTPQEPVKIFYRVDRENRRVVTPEQFRELADAIVRPDGLVEKIGAGQYDHLYRNNADGTFTDISEAAGIAGNHYGLSATWWDYNRDGHPDLYVANDFWGPDHLYRNRGDGTFIDVAARSLPHTPWFSMGSDVADIDNDGLLDLMGADMSGTSHYKQKISMGDMDKDGWFLEFAEPRQYMRNALYLNTGTERFMEIAHLAGVAGTDWTWSLKFGDLDNDGRVDLFVTNGMTRDWFNSDLRKQADAAGDRGTLEGMGPWLAQWLKHPARREPNLAFRNAGDLRFENVGPTWGLDHEGVSFGAALGDLDRDGDLDVVVNNFDEGASVYRNLARERRDEEHARHAVLIRLRGTTSNRHGIGAHLEVETPGGRQVRYLTLSRGYMSANDPLEHFGLGSHDRIDRLTVRWPSGHVQELGDLAADRLYTITEPPGPPAAQPRDEPPRPMFSPAPFETLGMVLHRERPFDEYARQPLLPNRLAQMGPGLAWADVDGDGDDDLFVGGGAGGVGSLHINTGGGEFRPRAMPALEADVEAEDMAPLFLDADGDGDHDLYVVSGGVECEPGDPLLRDRLYLNDGHGMFSAAPTAALPDLRDSGGAAAAADFDRDGDLDLFVGGRSIPGHYPVPARNRLLRNDGGRFTDVTDAAAPGLLRRGRVSSAAWSDADGDGRADLLLAREWGPVEFWRNEGGRLTDRTGEAGLADRIGWWNGIAARDIDDDGDIDYVVTNAGLNTKYHASDEHPTRLYYGDFEGTGVMRIVEAEYEGRTLFPVRGLSCSTSAMPHLGRRFGTYHDFGIAPLEEIYTGGGLEDAYTVEADTLESGVLINDGAARFTFHALPRMAQAAPGYGVVLTEVDGDGRADLVIAQNSYSPQRETGRMDGGVSLLLTGAGDGTFDPIRPDRSGLLVPGDAKSLTAADLDGDGRVDFTVGLNDDRLRSFINRTSKTGRVLAIRLAGAPGNPTGVGARVTVETADGRRQTAEVGAGGGYLSQSGAALVFGLGADARPSRVLVRWPDGRESIHADQLDEPLVQPR